MACDICGKTSTSTLLTVLDSYQTDEIKSICDDCAKKVNKHLDKLRSISRTWYINAFKDFMRNLKKEVKK